MAMFIILLAMIAFMIVFLWFSGSGRSDGED